MPTAITIHDLPTLDCCDPTAPAAALRHLRSECDSHISLAVNDLDVLNGYPGAYTYPTHAFVRSLSRGQAELLQSGAARIPIYLQQYEFASDSPHHLLLVESDGDEVRIDFQWATSIRRPSAAPDVHGEMLLRREWEAAVRACVDSYLAAVRGLFARASVETRAAVEGMLADLG